MNTNGKKILLSSLVVALSILSCTAVSAYRGGNGGFHGGGVQRNDGDLSRNGDMDRTNRAVDGYYQGDNWGTPAINVGIPNNGYYSSQCQSVQVCDSYGNCTVEQNCD